MCGGRGRCERGMRTKNVILVECIRDIGSVYFNKGFETGDFVVVFCSQGSSFRHFSRHG